MKRFVILFLALLATTLPVFATAGTIDVINKYAWSNNIGWINFGCTGCNVVISDTAITGYAWSENYGWINLAPSTGGVVNTARTLSGYAWGENVGWIDFTGVTINSSDQFTGTATGDVVGTINFDCTSNGCPVTTDITAPVITINNPDNAWTAGKTITASTNEGTLAMSNILDSTCDGTLTFITYASQTFTNGSDNGTKVCYKAVDTSGNTTYTMSANIAGITTGSAGGSVGGGASYYTITASAGANGSISPAGSATIVYGGNQTYIITPNTGYKVADVLVDNVSVGAVTTYTFNSITGGHTISAILKTEDLIPTPIPTPTPTPTNPSTRQDIINYVSNALNGIRSAIANLFGGQSNIQPVNPPPIDLQPTTPPSEPTPTPANNQSWIWQTYHRIIGAMTNFFQLFIFVR